MIVNWKQLGNPCIVRIVVAVVVRERKSKREKESDPTPPPFYIGSMREIFSSDIQK